MRQLKYPATRRTDVSDMQAEVSFPDPFRWLEENTEVVRRWQRAQSELASERVRGWPHFEALKSSVARFSVGRFAPLPRYAGRRWFRTATPSGSTQSRVFVADSPNGEGRVLFDPRSENAASPPLLSWISPSPDGRTLALGVCADGSENNTIRLIDVASGQRLANPPSQTLMDNWTGGAQWLADSSGFYYTALKHSTHDFDQAIFFHRLGDPPPVEPVPLPAPSSSRVYRAVASTAPSRFRVAAAGQSSLTTS